MWMAGVTPKAWSQSRTILLYKKGNEYELRKWTPTALANTTFKLQTGMIAECNSRYVDLQDILSGAQEGSGEERVPQDSY